MAGRVTMADVAAAAGVSAKTVSNVLGDRGGYSPETGARVLAAVAGLGYRLNADARALRSRRSGVIALALPTLRQPMYAALAQAVLTIVTKHAPEFDGATMEMRPSSTGKYISLTCTITATSKPQLDALYRELSGHPMVKVVL